MPVNDKSLSTKIDALNRKENELREQIKKIRDCRYNLQEISRPVIRTDSGDEFGSIPNDRRTQKPFTTAARQKQYDDNLTLANKILSE